jgi:xylulokinase
MLGVSWDHAYSTAGRPWRADTPVFLPYLAQERWDPGARGCWAGLTLAHGRDDLLRAALEGLAFLLRDRLGDLRAAGHDPARVVIGGGGARHPAWRQLIADVLALPLYPAPTTWLSATGATLVAAAAGGAAIVRAAAQPAPVTSMASHDVVDAGYERFHSLRRAAPG